MLRQMDRGREARRIIAELGRGPPLAGCPATAAEAVRQRDKLTAGGARLGQSYPAVPAMPGFARVQGAARRAVHGTPKGRNDGANLYPEAHQHQASCAGPGLTPDPAVP